jgi:site-specific DNA-methyltransferase (adenine-specific)/site-specific DNA-methyltransferase (cytosine-N4-specific)
VLAEDGSWFVNIKEHCEDGQRSLYVKDLTLEHVRAWGWRFVDELCWKHHGYPGEVFDRFHNAWEPIFHYATAKRCKCRPDSVSYASDNVIAYKTEHREAMTHDPNHKSGAIRISGRAYPRNVIELSNGASTSIAGHAATFPIGLPEFFIKAYSDPGDLVYDPFMGSGTTLIAAAQNGRHAVGCEISAGYCDIIRRRWTKWALANGQDPGSGALQPVTEGL